jgi:predicted HicB family RNase H-like nuclease
VTEAPATAPRKAVMVRMPLELHAKLMAARTVDESMNDLCIKYIEQGLEKLQSPPVEPTGS